MNWLFLLISSNILVACLIACLAYFVGRNGRNVTLAHALWLCVFVKLITPPLLETPITLPHAWTAWTQSLQSVFPGISTDARHDNPTSNSDAAVGAHTGPSAAKHEPSSKHYSRSVFRWFDMTAFQVALLVWMCGSCLIIARGVLRFAGFSRLLQRESMVDEDASQQVRQLLDNPRFTPPVRLIAARVSPMLFGIGGQTCIVCPQPLWHSLSVVERRAFLAHEVAHFRRRDHWVRWLEWFVTAVYWWLPLVYIARKQLERHEEAACDAWAIGNLRTAPRDYAEALLSVVDFLSETTVGVPRMASRMQATESLEERIRWIMAADKPHRSPVKFHMVLALCVALLMIHPSPRYRVQAATQTKGAIVEATLGLASSRSTAFEPPEEDGMMVPLPQAPSGWWNEAPTKRFADVRLGDRNLRMLAEAGIGVTVQAEGRVPYDFEPESVCALAYIPSSSRMIIGNSLGEIHLWDVHASQSVSLIGRHQAAIGSLAFHQVGGLVSGDQEGNLIRWDLQSGQMLEIVSVLGPVASVRWSRTGDQLSVVVGSWSAARQTVQWHIRDGRTLESLQEIALPNTIATVQQDDLRGWLAIDWSGTVLSLSTGESVAHVPKAEVSGFVLSQELFDSLLLNDSHKGLQ